jgi:hypothetical protein
MKVQVGRNKGFYQAYIRGYMVEEIETSIPGLFVVCICPLELKRTNDAECVHWIGFTPMNV